MSSSTPHTTLQHSTDVLEPGDTPALPFLYTRREYPTPGPQAGGTTTCKIHSTSPVSEYGPDD